MIFKIKKFTRENIPFVVPALRAGVSMVRAQASQRLIRRMLSEKTPLFVELGAGDKKGEGGWVTVDMTERCDIFWDLRNGLPFPDGSVSKIYSSHFFEHLSYQETQTLLDECLRVLIPAGTFSICVPNAKLFLDAYSNPDLFNEDQLLGYKPAHNHTTKIDYLNYIGYMNGEHRYMFDEENLLHILKAKGFNNAHSRPFDPGLDLQDRDYVSIYAEAEK